MSCCGVHSDRGRGAGANAFARSELGGSFWLVPTYQRCNCSKTGCDRSPRKAARATGVRARASARCSIWYSRAMSVKGVGDPAVEVLQRDELPARMRPAPQLDGTGGLSGEQPVEDVCGVRLDVAHPAGQEVPGAGRPRAVPPTRRAAQVLGSGDRDGVDAPAGLPVATTPSGRLLAVGAVVDGC